MANPKIKVKRSSVAGKVPAPTQLERGELAVNSYDGKVYIVKDQFSVGIATTTTTVNPWLETGIGVGLSYSGDVKIVGILTVGSSSLTLDGTNNTVKVGTALTLGHSQGLQFHTQNLHATGFEVNNINVSGASTVAGTLTANHGVTGNINSTGISTISGFTFPSTDGSEDQALVTDGNGSLSFKTLSGGGGGAVGSATTISTSNTVATQGQTAFIAPNVFDDGVQATTFSVQVSINGVKQRLGASNDYQLAAPRTVTFNSGLTAGDNVQISVYFGHTFEEEFFTSTQNQTTFTLSGNLAAAKNYRVFLNGVRLRRDIDYQASAAVVLAEACLDGDEVDICSDQAEDQLTANAGQSSFAPSNSDTSSDNMEVYLNGILLQRTVDWTIGSPAITIINPASGLDLGDELDVVVRRS